MARRLAAAAVLIIAISVVQVTNPLPARTALDNGGMTGVSTFVDSTALIVSGRFHQITREMSGGDVVVRSTLQIDRLESVIREREPVPTVGDLLDIFTPGDYDIAQGSIYLVFLSYNEVANDALPAWRAWLVLDGPDPVPGTFLDMADDLDHLLAPDEDATDLPTAVIEYTLEQVTARDAGLPVATGAPRTGLLEAWHRQLDEDPDARGVQQRLDSFLAMDPVTRFLGFSVNDLPEGAADALDVRFVDARVLVLYGPENVLDLPGIGVWSPQGRSHVESLDPANDSLLIPFVTALDEPVTVNTVTEMRTRGRFLTDRLELPADADTAPPRLLVDLRGPTVTTDWLRVDDFDELVLTHRP